MNPRNTLTLTSVVLLCLTVALPAGDAAAQQKSLKNQLVGAWTLVSLVDIYPSGTKQQFQGSNPKGILIFDAGGRYAAISGPTDRAKFKVSRQAATAEELHASMDNFIANFGTWSVNEADKTLIRRIDGALSPNVEGTLVNSGAPVTVSLAGDELKLTQAAVPGGTGRELATSEIVYKRAK
jgi:hypothetical protein